MAFAQSVVDQAFDSSGGRCECTRATHPHGSNRCTTRLQRANRGRELPGGWEAHHRTAGGPDTLSNCQILCWPCHKATF
jgi:5-methylcytosine-specific restriction endonuclease McrA